MLLNLLLVYIGNWAGTLFVAYFFGYLTNLFDHKQQVEFLYEYVGGKLTLGAFYLKWLLQLADSKCLAQDGGEYSSEPFLRT